MGTGIAGPFRQKIGIRCGDMLQIFVEKDRIVLTEADKPKYEARIVDAPCQKSSHGTIAASRPYVDND